MNRLARLILAIRIRAVEIHLAQIYDIETTTLFERQRLFEVRERLFYKLARLRGEYRVRFMKPGAVYTHELA